MAKVSASLKSSNTDSAKESHVSPGTVTRMMDEIPPGMSRDDLERSGVPAKTNQEQSGGIHIFGYDKEGRVFSTRFGGRLSPTASETRRGRYFGIGSQPFFERIQAANRQPKEKTHVEICYSACPCAHCCHSCDCSLGCQCFGWRRWR